MPLKSGPRSYASSSATPHTPSHFVLAGLSIPISRWRETDQQVSAILGTYELANEELHTAWLLRPYLEQSRILGFASMPYAARRAAVLRARPTLLNSRRFP